MGGIIGGTFQAQAQMQAAKAQAQKARANATMPHRQVEWTPSYLPLRPEVNAFRKALRCQSCAAPMAHNVCAYCGITHR